MKFRRRIKRPHRLPDTWHPCAKGPKATARLHELLSAPFTVRQAGLRDEDKYCHKLRVLTRGGWSISDFPRLGYAYGRDPVGPGLVWRY